MIYLVTFLSDSFHVKGYLSVPTELHYSLSDLNSALRCFYGSSELTANEIASSLRRERQDIRLYNLPALIYCRGGIGKVGRVQTQWIEQFANQGHLVFAPCYRGSEGGEGRDEFGGSDVEDVVSAYRFLCSLPFVDSSRISIIGFSRGAINAVRTAAKISGINKLILWGGVSDLVQTYEERIDLRKMLKRVLGGSPAGKPDAYQLRSPLLNAEYMTCPVLVIHGTEDMQVDYSHGLNMYSKLKDLGKPTVMHTYEGYGHHLPPAIHTLAIKRMFKWIEDSP
jgi:dipeptidyl aminopeptidase/acylaminoacyl peptidase